MNELFELVEKQAAALAKSQDACQRALDALERGSLDLAETAYCEKQVQLAYDTVEEAGEQLKQFTGSLTHRTRDHAVRVRSALYEGRGAEADQPADAKPQAQPGQARKTSPKKGEGE